jgi:hypothetical protein
LKRWFLRLDGTRDPLAAERSRWSQIEVRTGALASADAADADLVLQVVSGPLMLAVDGCAPIRIEPGSTVLYRLGDGSMRNSTPAIPVAHCGIAS